MEELPAKSNSPRPKPWAGQGTPFLVLICSGCASAEPYPSQNEKISDAQTNPGKPKEAKSKEFLF